MKKDKFIPGTIKLSDEAIQARKKAREERLKNFPTVDEIIKDKQRRRTEDVIQTIKEHKKEIFLSYILLIALITVPLLIAHLIT